LTDHGTFGIHNFFFEGFDIVHEFPFAICVEKEEECLVLFDDVRVKCLEQVDIEIVGRFQSMQNQAEEQDLADIIRIKYVFLVAVFYALSVFENKGIEEGVHESIVVKGEVPVEKLVDERAYFGVHLGFLTVIFFPRHVFAVGKVPKYDVIIVTE